MIIEDKIIKTEKVAWQDLKDLQPDNLKNPFYSNLTKESLIKNGFAFTFYVWQDKKDIFLIDGHLRKDLLLELKADGYNIPSQLNCTFLDLKNRKEAVRYLLEVFNTKKNPLDEEVLLNWIGEEDIELEDINIEWIDLKKGEGGDEVEIEKLEAKEDDFETKDVDKIQTDIVRGDIFKIKKDGIILHRLMCGDSTSIDDVEKLMNGEMADIAHNDPPYGMKKEKDGVVNDNLNFDDLLQFNKDWISLQFTVLKDNGSFYCWGTDEPLMDIYSNILKPYIKTQKATFRNLITWDKGHGHGQNSEAHRMYPTADEKCLFVMCGVQGFNNNADNYFEGWEPVRDYLLKSRLEMGWDVPSMKKIVGHSGLSRDHWTSKSQFSFPTREVYNKMKNEADKLRNETKNDAFEKEYDELKKEYYSTRAYFDNTHDNMNNIWHFERTSTKERENNGNHATPKPIALCERVIKSSSAKGGLVIDFFLGSGSTMVACHQLNRKCYGMELEPKYCQVIIDRMKKLDKDIIIEKL